MDELLAYLRAKDVAREREAYLRIRNYVNPHDPEFLLNIRTKLLTPRDDQAKVLGDRLPLAVFVAIPDPPLIEIVDPTQEPVWDWLNDHRKQRYEPAPDQKFLRGMLRPVLDGVIATDHHSNNESCWRSFVAFGRTGILEMGIGSPLYVVQREDTVAVRLLTLIGSLWQFLNCATEWFNKIKQERSFTLWVGVRGIEGTLLGGVARGWAEPGSGLGVHQSCLEPGFWIEAADMEPTQSEDARLNIVRHLATKIDNAWGYRLPRCFSHKECDPDERFDDGRFRQLDWW